MRLRLIVPAGWRGLFNPSVSNIVSGASQPLACEKGWGVILTKGRAMKRVMILNGPNLNLLGVREPHIYGTTTLSQIKENCEAQAEKLGLKIAFHQSNHEGVIVDLIQSARQDADAIIINPAGFSFTSVAIMDAIKAFEGPVLEVHISNIHARDEYHRHSKISFVATGVICGLGPYGYVVAMHAIAAMK